MGRDVFSRRIWAILAGLTVLAGVILRWRAFDPFAISHADELMQYLEQGRRLAMGDGIVPWEYRVGARNGIIAQILCVPWWLAAKLAPGTLIPMLVTRISFAVMTSAMAMAAAWRLGALSGRAQAWMALFVAAVWYECVLFSTLLLSEVLATGLIALALAPVLAERRSVGALRLAGLLLGLGVLVRLQYAPFVGVFALAALRGDWRAWRALVQGALVAVVIGALSDLGMGHWPYGWIWTNVSYNIGHDVAAHFGVMGPLGYLSLLFVNLGPGVWFIGAGALLAPARYRPVVLALCVNILLHSLIAHKEYRFIWLSTFLMLVLAAITGVGVVQRMSRGRGIALAGLAGLWLAASVVAERTSGAIFVLHRGASIPEAALDGVRQGGACGIAVSNGWRAHLVPALLPTPVPIYIAPQRMENPAEPLPPEIARAANVLVFARRPPGADAYRPVSCHDNGAIRACAFVRAGGCTPARDWTYQAVLTREGL
jgi:GPI mannosyltransferase 3